MQELLNALEKTAESLPRKYWDYMSGKKLKGAKQNVTNALAEADRANVHANLAETPDDLLRLQNDRMNYLDEADRLKNVQDDVKFKTNVARFGTAGAGAYLGALGYATHKDLERYKEATTHLLDDLEKTAAGRLEPVKNFFGNVSGRNLKNAQNKQRLAQKESNILDERHSSLTNDLAKRQTKDSAPYQTSSTHQDSLKRNLQGKAAVRNEQKNVAKAQKDTSRDRKIAVGAGAGVAASAGGGAYLANKNREKEAFTHLLNDLEKTAAGRLEPIKNYFGNVTGNNLKKATKEVGEASEKRDFAAKRYVSAADSHSPKADKRLAIFGERSKRVEEAEGKVRKSEIDTKSARVGTVAAGAGLGVGATAGAVAASKKKDTDTEKTASENFMSEMYKEAAAQIMETTFPSVQEVVDPIHRIKFDK